MASRNNKVLKYRRKPKAAAIIFAVVFLYVICFVAIYFSKSKVTTYEVNAGSITSNASFTGIALRTETVYNSDYSGNIDYYQREGTRVKTGDTLYTVDETGRVSQILAQYSDGGQNSLSSQSLASIKSTLNNFRTNYDGNNFSGIYDLKADLNSTVLEAMNENIMANIESIIESTGSQNLFRTIKSQQGGIIVYSTDGYEGMTPDTIIPDALDKSKYNKTNLKSEQLIVSGHPAYKLVNNENWYICIPLTQAQIKEYDLSDKKSVNIKLKKDNIETSGGFSIVNKDGNYYGKISLNQYMIRYATERYLDIELVTTNRAGLKVPVSSVTESEFYTIPKEYLTTGGNSNSYGFICNSYNESNQMVSNFVEADIYKSTDSVCYVSKGSFKAGDIIVKPDSSQQYVIGPIEKLKGVYCINTGYTVFKLVEILDQNNEYYIVKKNVSHGISVYDRLVLDADKYTENQMIY